MKGQPLTTSIYVLGFAGSLRSGSHYRAILRAAAELLPAGMRQLRDGGS